MATGTAGTDARKYHTYQKHYLMADFVFASAAVTITLGTVPAGATVIDAGVVVSTAFNSGTSDKLDIGTDGDTNGMATLLELQTIGRIVADEMATSNDLGPYAADDIIQAVYTPVGTAATAGAGRVYVEYLVDDGS